MVSPKLGKYCLTPKVEGNISPTEGKQFHRVFLSHVHATSGTLTLPKFFVKPSRLTCFPTDTVMHYRPNCCRQGTTTFITMIMIMEQNSVLISARIWYQTNLVLDFHDTRTRNWRQKMELNYGTSFCSMCHGPKTALRLLHAIQQRHSVTMATLVATSTESTSLPQISGLKPVVAEEKLSRRCHDSWCGATVSRFVIGCGLMLMLANAQQQQPNGNNVFYSVQ